MCGIQDNSIIHCRTIGRHLAPPAELPPDLNNLAVRRLEAEVAELEHRIAARNPRPRPT